MDSYRREVINGAKEVEVFIKENEKEEITKTQIQRLLKIGLWKASEIMQTLKDDGVVEEMESGAWKVIKFSKDELMTDAQMKKLLLNLQVGSLIEIEVKGIGGTYKEIGNYKGKLKHNGFYIPGGGWWCYSLKDYDKKERECWEFYFTPKGKRKPYIMKIGYKVVKIKIIK